MDHLRTIVLWEGKNKEETVLGAVTYTIHKEGAVLYLIAVREKNRGLGDFMMNQLFYYMVVDGKDRVVVKAKKEIRAFLVRNGFALRNNS